MATPFMHAELRSKRLKILFWGESGCGKTTTSLQFPAPCVIDLEGGTDLYGKAFDFGVIHTSDFDEVFAAVRWLANHEHPYATVVIDPFTVVWESLQRKWTDIFLQRNRGSKGFRHEFYELQPKDWSVIKADLRSFLRTVVGLDMNVVVTCRAKPQYATGSFMRPTGSTTIDAEKSLPYLFDTVVKVARDSEGQFWGEVEKDRSNTLPKDRFRLSYSVFEDAFGKDELERRAQPKPLATAEQVERLNQLFEQRAFNPEAIKDRLKAYGADSVASLNEEDAALIISRLADRSS